MFIDASAIIAIITFEPDKLSLSQRLAGAKKTFISPIVLFEAALGLARKANCRIDEANATLEKFIKNIDAEIVPIDAEIGQAALRAHDIFGKGRHKASLNMGDCFAYACAKSRNIPLLYKGNDFIHTDILSA